ncbi:MAG: hypothetical protein JSU79_04355 [Dehalococcoidales bacterium]|nr:MAG: hypothetical protein JSU79_04355 [Dehalococcoidales bacterium]
MKKISGQTRIVCYLSMVLISLLSLLIFPSCGESGTRILYSGSKVGDQISASYELFTGIDRKTFNIDVGDKISFSYVSSVEKGKLKMEIYNPDDILITSFTSNKTGTKQLVIEKTGKHTVKITGNQTKGRYQIRWNILN